jgi:hypothetical protein
LSRVPERPMPNSIDADALILGDPFAAGLVRWAVPSAEGRLPRRHFFRHRFLLQ